MKIEKERQYATLISSVVIHSVFCAQAVYAAQDRSGGMVAGDFFLLAFLPQYFFMFFLPPAWPSAEMGDAYWWRVVGKLAVSYPASFLYGWFVGLIFYLGLRLCRRSGGSTSV